MKKSFIILLLLLSSCSKEDRVTSYLDSFAIDKYFDKEVFSESYLGFYGLWKALGAWGGWGGYSEPDFIFLEIKPFGIYGFIRNDSLIEYGKISPNTDIVDNFVGIPVKLDPVYTSGKHPNFGSSMYIELVRKDTLGVYSGFIDGVTFIFSRVK